MEGCAAFLIGGFFALIIGSAFIASTGAGIIATMIVIVIVVLWARTVIKEAQKKDEIANKKVSERDVVEYKKNMQRYMETFEEYSWLREKPQIIIKAADLNILGREYKNLYRLAGSSEKGDTCTYSYTHDIILNIGAKNGKVYLFPMEGAFYTKGSWADKFSIDSIPHDIYPYTINIDNIDYYMQRGERQVYTTTSGGADPAGALVGGVLFGAAGAIIGNSEKVKSQVHVEDTREVVLYYKKDGENQVLHFFLAAFDSFKRVIPEFDIAVKSNRNDRQETFL